MIQSLADEPIFQKADKLHRHFLSGLAVVTSRTYEVDGCRAAIQKQKRLICSRQIDALIFWVLAFYALFISGGAFAVLMTTGLIPEGHTLFAIAASTITGTFVAFVVGGLDALYNVWRNQKSRQLIAHLQAHLSARELDHLKSPITCVDSAYRLLAHVYADAGRLDVRLKQWATQKAPPDDETEAAIHKFLIQDREDMLMRLEEAVTILERRHGTS